MTRLIGISSSPVENENTEHLARHMLEAGAGMGCATDLFLLSWTEVKPWVHCNACITK